jgi:signal transduction histidine kinase
VKGIIENHGGKMRVRSKLGAGTVFKFDLPVVR